MARHRDMTVQIFLRCEVGRWSVGRSAVVTLMSFATLGTTRTKSKYQKIR